MRAFCVGGLFRTWGWHVTNTTSPTSAAADLFVLGFSHRTAPLSVREKVADALTHAGSEWILSLHQEGGVRETMLLATCNRVEVYGCAADTYAATERIKRALLSEFGADINESHFYTTFADEALNHAFRVAASLDSMVVGEPQILGQVKDAFEAARSAGTVSRRWGRIFPQVFSAAKRVRTETDIGAGAVGVSSIAVLLAERIFGVCLVSRHYSWVQETWGRQPRARLWGQAHG